MISSPLIENDRLTLVTKMPQTESEAETFWRVVMQEKVGLILSLSDSMEFKEMMQLY